MDIWYYPGDYLPVMTSNTGWTQVATAVPINLPAEQQQQILFILLKYQ